MHILDVGKTKLVALLFYIPSKEYKLTDIKHIPKKCM